MYTFLISLYFSHLLHLKTKCHHSFLFRRCSYYFLLECNQGYVSFIPDVMYRFSHLSQTYFTIYRWINHSKKVGSREKKNTSSRNSITKRQPKKEKWYMKFWENWTNDKKIVNFETVDDLWRCLFRTENKRFDY